MARGQLVNVTEWANVSGCVNTYICDCFSCQPLIVSVSVVAPLGTSYLVAVLSSTSGRTDHAITCCSRPLGAQPRPGVLTLAKEDASQKKSTRVCAARPPPPCPAVGQDPHSHTFTHMVDSIKTSQHVRTQSRGPRTEPTRSATAGWSSGGYAHPASGTEHRANGVDVKKASSARAVKGKRAPPARGGGRIRQQKKNTTTAATAPHYEAGSCEDGGLRLLPVTHQKANGTTHMRHARTAAGALGKPKQSVGNAATTDKGDPPPSPAPPPATPARAVSTADGEQQPAMRTTTD